MTRQQMFTKAVTALYKQGRVSMTGSGFCRYRNSDGDKCAIGHLIPDDKYSPGMEGSTVDSNENIQKAIGLDQGNKAFARDLQLIHDAMSTLMGYGELQHRDQSSFRKELLHRSELFAKKYNLDMPKLPRIKKNKS